MEFKYFKNPKYLAAFVPNRINCSICGYKDKCFDGELFYGEIFLEGVCYKCLINNRLAEKEVYTNDADVEELYEQIVALYPNKTKEERVKMTKERTEELEFRTPSILSWTDWKYPALDGDYAVFIEFASKASLNELAPDQNGKAFFKANLYKGFDEMINLDLLWDSLPEQKINTVEETDHDFLAYLFQSIHSEKYTILWDSH